MRGFALLGILVMNIPFYAMVEEAGFNPNAYGKLEGVNFAVWLLSHIFFEGKFITLFSLLFGAGIVLMAERGERAGLSPARLHYRRMIFLLLFGLAHAYLLWYGDILFSYALCGMAVYPLRRLRPSRLIVLGIFLIAVPSVILLYKNWSLMHLSGQTLAALDRAWTPSRAALDYEIEIYRSGWFEQMRHRVLVAFSYQTHSFFVWTFWRTSGVMLAGMALMKTGFFTGRYPRQLYLALPVLGVIVGMPLIAWGVHRNIAEHWRPSFSRYTGVQFNYWASLLVGLAYAGALVLITREGWARRLTRRLAAVGRMALTHYLSQTIICTTIFYGHGLGMFGRVDRIGQIGIVLAIWAFQLGVSPAWLRQFRFGPFEWLWRSLTYGRFQPMRRSSS